MAKKTIKKEGQLPDPLELVTDMDDKSEILSESVFSNIPDWISCGSYICNACISGSIFRGAPAGRIITLAGENSTGKSFLASSILREAQKKSYTPVYLDSEGGMTRDFFARIGGDPNKIIVRQVNTITEVSHFVLNLLDKLIEQQEQYGEHNKYAICLDSLANLSSTKEVEDISEGNVKRDMTKAQEIRQMFRVISVKLATTGTLMIVCNQVYSSLNPYGSPTAMGGGGGIAYNSSATLELTALKLQDKQNDDAASKAVNSEDIVKTGSLIKLRSKKNRFAIPRVARMMIPFYKKINPFFGLESYMTWENSGVCRGNIISEKEYSKLSDKEKEAVHTFEFNGQTMYAVEKQTARGIVVAHLGEVVPITEFLTEKVFTDEFLHKLDDEVIRPAFELPNQNAFDDIKEIEDLINVGEDE